VKRFIHIQKRFFIVLMYMPEFLILSDYNKLFYELFNNVDVHNCKSVMDFIKNNKKLLQKVVNANFYGIPRGSTCFHILAISEFNTILNTSYSTQTMFSRNIHDDVYSIISCIDSNLNNDNILQLLKELNIVDNEDENGDTVMDIIIKNIESAKDKKDKEKYSKLKHIVESIQEKDNVDELPLLSNDIIKIEIDKSSIVKTTQTERKKILRLRQNKEKKPYKITIVKNSKFLRSLSKKSKSRSKTVKRSSSKNSLRK